jgi:hypothetical protein
LLCRGSSILCSPICQSFLLVAELLEFYWGSPYLCLLLPGYSFKVLGLILRSFIHFELILVQGDRYGSSFSFLHADIQYS